MRLYVRWVAALIVLVGVGRPEGVRAAEAGDAGADSTAQVRSPRGAMLRSLALPGWGQFYNRRYVKGGIVAAAEVGSVAAFFVRRRRIEQQGTDGQTSSRRNVFLFTTIGVLLYGMADAYVDAHLDMVDWAEVEAGPGAAQVRVMFRF